MSMTATAHERKPTSAGMSSLALGVLAFIGSEVVFFGCLIAAYLYLRVRLGVWPPEGTPPLEVLFPAINTAVLLASGATMHWAHKAIERGNQSSLVAVVIYESARVNRNHPGVS